MLKLYARAAVLSRDMGAAKRGGRVRFSARHRLCPACAASACLLAPLPLRHRQREDAAFAGLAFGGYARVVEAGYLFDEREAEAQAAA